MRLLCGSPQKIVSDLKADHSKKHPFVFVVSNRKRCVIVCRILADRTWDDETPREKYVEKHEGGNIEWTVTTPDRGMIVNAGSVALEDGALSKGWALDKTPIPNCIAIADIDWKDAASGIGVHASAFKRGLRTCSCYGFMAFVVMFFIALLWESRQ